MSRNEWTKEEVAILEKNLDKSPQELTTLINRTVNAIRIKKENITFEPKEKICKRCKKKYIKDKRSRIHCEACEKKISQERRIKKQVAVANEDYQKEVDLIKELSKGTYTCNVCKEEKSGEEFYFDRATQRLKVTCKTCFNKRSKESRKKRMSEGRDW